MSVFIVYFEIAKKIEEPVANYKLYKEVNNYVLPDIFNACSTKFYFHKKEIVASEFSYGVESLLKYDKEVRKIFTDFISVRLDNPCIQPMIYIYFNNNSLDDLYINIQPEVVRISELCGYLFIRQIKLGLFSIIS